MLRAKTTRPRFAANGLRFAIIAARYNQRYTDALVQHASRALRLAGAAPGDIRIVRVPGAFEIPVVASRLASSGHYDALIALGVIIRGETAHADLIGTEITRALGAIALREELPVIHEVLLLNNQQQAHARCLDARHNRGTEAALTAIEMARLMKEL
ncbi:MAG: 6,7-dimethyl-8-ribityllumazine synthase [Verrucomicrobiae bacterium]|nr:6,7-dimethyl-8-ribityllumazine synthase [Verrucomicrobiae bacterium]